MDLPPEVVIPICIERGSLYHFKIEVVNRDGTKYSGERFFIVLNTDPKNGEVIILTTITSKVASQQKFIATIGEDPITLVPITRADFPLLSVDSVVNCNKTYEFSQEELIQKIKEGGKIFHHRLPKVVVDALVQGVLVSNQVPQDHKKKLV